MKFRGKGATAKLSTPFYNDPLGGENLYPEVVSYRALGCFPNGFSIFYYILEIIYGRISKPYLVKPT